MQDSLHSTAFVYLSDKEYFKPLCISIYSARSVHPEIKVIVYDVGLTKQQIEFLKNHDFITLIEWWPFLATKPFSANTMLSKIISAILFPLSIKKKLYIIESILYHTYKSRKRLSPEVICAQKPYVLLHAHYILDGYNLIMMDADTAVLGSIEDLVRTEPYKILAREVGFIPRLEKGDCRALFAGLIVIKGSNEQKQVFLHSWIRQMSQSYEPMSEQSALTRLIETFSQHELIWGPGEYIHLKIEGKEIIIELIACEQYCAMDQNAVKPPQPKIIHFKGWRHKSRFHEQCIINGLEKYYDKIPILS